MRENGLPPSNVLEREVAAEHAFTRVPVASPSTRSLPPSHGDGPRVHRELQRQAPL